MTNDAWSPKQYELFKEERQQPFFDLLSLIKKAKPIANAVDLGCGTGELTQILHRNLQIGETLGIDSSKSMLMKAREFKDYGLAIEEGLLEKWHAPDGVDLIFSNAALQWAPDHRALIPLLLTNLRPGGQIAVQVPANHDHITHRLAAEVAQEEPFNMVLGGYTRISPVLLIEEYAALLHSQGLTDVVCYMKVYGHVLPSPRSVIEWVRGTLLTDYQARMKPDLYSQFLERYTERLLGALCDEPYFYPFKRILFRAVKKETTLLVINHAQLSIPI